MARPKAKVDEALLEKLAVIHVPDIHLADCLGISVWTLNRRYAQKIDKFKSQGKAKLIMMAWKKAEAGEWAAIKFLLQNYLGMSDKVENNNVNTENVIIRAFDPEKLKPNGKD